jgi:plastocyanin
MRNVILAIALALSLLLLSATPKPPPPKKISIAGGKFTPATLNITVGDTVQWSNDDDQDHTIEADDGSFASAKLKGGATFDHKFTKAGTYAYHCKLHPREKGKVTVVVGK